jgi:hypothetical protein
VAAPRRARGARNGASLTSTIADANSAAFTESDEQDRPLPRRREADDETSRRPTATVAAENAGAGHPVPIPPPRWGGVGRGIQKEWRGIQE